jgi:hypothetical protein
MLPEGHDADAPMRCPLCQAEYPLGEALASLPPALIPLTQPPKEMEPIFPIVTGQPAEAGEASVLHRPGRRKSKSAKRLILEMIFGGLAGLLIAYYALWWIQGDSCQLPRIPWLPLLPPAHSTDNINQ